jgi:HlyD family secretion protein
VSAAWALLAVNCCLLAMGCQRPSARANPTVAKAAEAPKATEKNEVKAPAVGPVRATGTIQAVRAYTVQVPQITGQVTGQPNRLILVKLVPNGSKVQKDDILAGFDRTSQLDAAREAKARYEDLSHQVRQRSAQSRSDAEIRAAALKEAEAELARAQLQIRKGPILSEIDRLKNEEKAKAAQAKVESFKKINAFRTKADAAALHILELQTERQKVALDRAQTNSEKLVLRAPIGGMVALENIWRGGSMGNAQEGDQLWPGQGLLKIFDPAEMEVLALVGEPDGAVLKPGATAMVSLDAYPDIVFQGRFHSASPVATTALGSPIKNFSARFRLAQSDPRLLPDLSAAVVIQPGGAEP